MDLSIIKNTIVDITKGIGETLIKELSNYMNNNQLTDDAKVKVQNETREMLKEYNGIYEVKNRVVYEYTKNSKYPELKKALYNGQKNGYYTLQDLETNTFNQELNNEIDQKKNEIKNKIINELNKYLDSCRLKGEEYIVDELGDDEKYVYLTRKSDNVEFQDFKITDEMYERIKESFQDKQTPTLIWNGNEYVMKD